jgi:DNA repair protein RadD
VSELRQLWPWIERGIAGVKRAAIAGHRGIVLTAPTGAGKTSAQAELARLARDKGKRCILLVDRKTITDHQTKTLMDRGVFHSVIAADEEDSYDPREPVTLARVQTLQSRVERNKLYYPDADVVIVDEGHVKRFWQVAQDYKARGAVVILFTATPIGIKTTLATELITAGTKAECREHGALVEADVFCPNEPNLKGVKKKWDGDYDLKGDKFYRTYVHADVVGNWKRLNPFALPTILFAPGVRESVWFRDQFTKIGVKAEHLDGETGNDERRQLFEASAKGDLPIICSCDVLSYGADLPWICHGIMCKPYGTLTSWLQNVGRLLRAHPGKQLCTVQDHAGATRRLCDPNDDIEWKLDRTDAEMQKARNQRIAGGKEQEPIFCPKCGKSRKGGPKCPTCGHEHVKSSRAVIYEDGTIERKHGATIKLKQPGEDNQKLWTSCLFAASKAGLTVGQAARMFHGKAGKWPDNVKPWTPINDVNWGRRVVDAYEWRWGQWRAKEELCTTSRS